MRSSSGEGSHTKWRWAPFLILSTAFCFFTWRSWRTWPDVLVDFGHELYIPWRLIEGDRLYETIAFTMGPLSQSFNATLFRIFGASLNTLIAANLVILAGITALLFCIFRRCGTRATATGAALFFLAVFAFSQYSIIGNYNYVCPYRHEVTHGLALGLAELYCLIRFSETLERRWLAAAGFCLGLVSLTKAEPLLPAVACAGIALLTVRIPLGNHVQSKEPSTPLSRFPLSRFPLGRFPSIRLIGPDALTLLAAAAIAPVLSVLLFATTRGLAGAWNATFGWLRYLFNAELTTNSGFYRSLAGWDAPAERSATIFVAIAGYTACLVIAYVVEALLGRAAKRRVVAIGLSVGTVPAALYLIGSLIPASQWSLLAGVVPVIVPLVVIGSGRRLVQNTPTGPVSSGRSTDSSGAAGSSTISLFLISVYSLCLLPKMFLNPSWGHYGFVLTMPGTLVLIHATLVSIPGWLQRKHMPGKAFTAVAAGLLTACALVQFLLWDRASQLKTVAFGAGGDQFYVVPDIDERALPALKTLEYLERNLRQEETLVVIPEGTTLNYLLRARNPTPYLMFSPWEFAAHGGEAVVEKSIISARPDYFVVVTMDMTIHGRGNFGDPGFGEGVLTFIKDEYQLVDAHVSPDESFQAAVFQRKLEDSNQTSVSGSTAAP